ncbi:MAG: hypothetical protein KDA84_30570, partial [Planctomycetaceae bacterium]|nr:hypothetical protein [Planctomycetaceae bacterium]
ISAIGVGSISDLRAATSHEVIGHVDVTRTFGESVYAHQTKWEWDEVLDWQFTWEEQHPELGIDTSLPVQEMIHRIDDEWGKLGEAFAGSQQRNDDFDEYKRRCRGFAKHLNAMKISPNWESYNFIASYAGANSKRAKNRVDDILRNSR